mgnify:CR=1 FL=1
MGEHRAEYTNRIAPKPGSFRESKKKNTPRYHGDTLRIHTGAKDLQRKQDWSEFKDPIENLIDTPARPHPMDVYCVFCNKDVTTELKYVSGGLTWIVSCILASFGGILGCCLLPFYVRTLKDMVHCCPKCNAYLAVYYRI